MNAIVANATAELADLAYEVYVEALDDLRSVHHVGLDLIESVERAALSTGGFESEALSYALCDYLADAPSRAREDFCRVISVGR